MDIAPFFTNSAQLEMIYNTTQDENLELLDNELWKDAEKPKIAKQKEIELEQAKLIEAMGAINKPQLANEYGNGIDY